MPCIIRNLKALIAILCTTFMYASSAFACIKQGGYNCFALLKTSIQKIYIIFYYVCDTRSNGNNSLTD